MLQRFHGTDATPGDPSDVLQGEIRDETEGQDLTLSWGESPESLEQVDIQAQIRSILDADLRRISPQHQRTDQASATVIDQAVPGNREHPSSDLGRASLEAVEVTSHLIEDLAQEVFGILRPLTPQVTQHRRGQCPVERARVRHRDRMGTIIRLPPER